MDAQSEIRTTSFWGKVNLVTIIMAMLAFAVWVGEIQSNVSQNSEDIEELQTEVAAVEQDIRAILIGIEQVKARLGIIESD